LSAYNVGTERGGKEISQTKNKRGGMEGKIWGLIISCPTDVWGWRGKKRDNYRLPARSVLGIEMGMAGGDESVGHGYEGREEGSSLKAMKDRPFRRRKGERRERTRTVLVRIRHAHQDHEGTAPNKT